MTGLQSFLVELLRRLWASDLMLPPSRHPLGKAGLQQGKPSSCRAARCQSWATGLTRRFHWGLHKLFCIKKGSERGALWLN